MIKRIRPTMAPAAGEDWRDLNEDVEVELTSEDPDWPIERALLRQVTTGLRADAPGPQTLSLAWPARRIRLIEIGAQHLEEHLGLPRHTR